MSTLFLVGAGPGDPELITLKAIKVLQKAEVILYDALVNESLLSHAGEGAICRFVGKRLGCHALSQAEINMLIVEYGQRFSNVVRLKGGDPFVFGRAQEEIDTAYEAGMKVEIVPGISSALAVPASEMIPLTARGTAESFWVTTGTTMSGEISSDLTLAAQSTATVVILMAMSRLEQIMELFAEHGKKDTPVAIIQNGTDASQKSVSGTVKDIAYRAAHAGLANPAIIVVGEVATLNLKKAAKQFAVSQLNTKRN